MAATPTYGPYNTPLTTIEHTAMASWSGFVYQGLCALHHTLVLLQRDWASAISKQLSLEAYEDFAILDSMGKIESFHQCKCCSTPTDFTDECKKMVGKEYYWKNVKGMLSATYDKMYFHSNQDNTLACGVEAYSFSPGVKNCNPFDIYARIEVLVREIMSIRRLAGSSQSKADRLISAISQQVSYIHRECINNPGNSFNIAASHPIPILKLASMLEEPQEVYTKDERIETCRHYLIMALEARSMVIHNVNKGKIDAFVHKVESLSHIDLQNFVRRIFPDLDITAADFNVGELINKQRANFLFNVIIKTDSPITLDTLDWKDSSGNRQTPSTIGCDKDPEEYCADIVNNPYSVDLRRDYRWIIGDIEHKVDDIEEGAQLITGVCATDYTDVTQTNKIGLKDINTKNDEDNA